MLETARDGSVLVRFGRTAANRVRTAVERSVIGARLVATEPDETNESDGDSDTDASTALERVQAGSTIADTIDSVESRLQTVSSAARITALGRVGRQYVTSSFCYRWLTAEPEPDVIVIDLRETLALGPFIAVVDRTLRGLATAVPTSAVTDTTAAVAESVRDRPIAVASLVTFPAVCLSLVVLGTALSLPLVGLHLVVAVSAALGLRSRRRLEDLFESRLMGLLIAAFEPPEPPTAEMRSDSRSDEQDDDQR